MHDVLCGGPQTAPIGWHEQKATGSHYNKAAGVQDASWGRGLRRCCKRPPPVPHCRAKQQPYVADKSACTQWWIPPSSHNVGALRTQAGGRSAQDRSMDGGARKVKQSARGPSKETGVGKRSTSATGQQGEDRKENRAAGQHMHRQSRALWFTDKWPRPAKRIAPSLPLSLRAQSSSWPQGYRGGGLLPWNVPQQRPQAAGHVLPGRVARQMPPQIHHSPNPTHVHTHRPPAPGLVAGDTHTASLHHPRGLGGSANPCRPTLAAQAKRFGNAS